MSTENNPRVGIEILSKLTPEQMSQQVDLVQRLLSMAVNGTPPVRAAGFPVSGIDLALHALLTAFISVADGYELHTFQGAVMAYKASLELNRVHYNRARRAPSQVQ